MGRELTEYEKYQLEWMLKNGHSLMELINGLSEQEGYIDIQKVYADWQNQGFNGEIFLSEKEFEKDRDKSSLIEEFKEYCKWQQEANRKIIDSYIGNNHVIYSNEEVFREQEMWSEGADYFASERPEMFHECKSVDNCVNVLRDYYMNDPIDGWLDATEGNLDKDIKDEIVAIGTIGLWSGIRIGYKLTHSNNLKDILQFGKDCETGTWYVDDTTHELCSSLHHHDGTNYLTYYACSDVEAFEDAFHSNGDYMQYLRSLGDDVQKIYGFDWKQEVPSLDNAESEDEMEL